MSIQAVAWVLDESEAESLDRLVMISLANHANDQWEAWPSVRTIARESRISTNTVMAALRRLVALGELEQLDAGDHRRSARYRLTRSQPVDKGCVRSETVRRDQRRGSDTQRREGVSPRARQNQEPKTKTPQPPASGGLDSINVAADPVGAVIAALRSEHRGRPRAETLLAWRTRAAELAAKFPGAPVGLLADATAGRPAPNLALYRAAQVGVP